MELIQELSVHSEVGTEDTRSEALEGRGSTWVSFKGHDRGFIATDLSMSPLGTQEHWQ